MADAEFPPPPPRKDLRPAEKGVESPTVAASPRYQVPASEAYETIDAAVSAPPEPLLLHRRDGYQRSFDLAVLVAGHVLLAPFWALFWALAPLAVWACDRGPVFYRQERLGRGGRRFLMLKFRTMVPDAEVETGPVWASEDDARATPVGRMLRFLHLDEMPQMLNILRGEMSFVGPRPERPVLTERFECEIPGFSRRLLVRPGVTGMAQVRGRYATPPRQKLRYDLLYISRMSPWLDLKLLLLTPVALLREAWERLRAGTA